MEKNFGTIAYYIRRPDDRRKFKDRRLLLKHEYFDNNPERRINMIDRRVLGDRRKVLTKVVNPFWKDAS